MSADGSLRCLAEGSTAIHCLGKADEFVNRQSKQELLVFAVIGHELAVARRPSLVGRGISHDYHEAL
jgi:hypothetical protein